MPVCSFQALKQKDLKDVAVTDVCTPFGERVRESLSQDSKVGIIDSALSEECVLFAIKGFRNGKHEDKLSALERYTRNDLFEEQGPRLFTAVKISMSM